MVSKIIEWKILVKPKNLKIKNPVKKSPTRSDLFLSFRSGKDKENEIQKNKTKNNKTGETETLKNIKLFPGSSSKTKRTVTMIRVDRR